MNRTIIAACIWMLIIIAALIGFSDDPKETVCIAAQSLSITGDHIIDATECFTP